MWKTTHNILSNLEKMDGGKDLEEIKNKFIKNYKGQAVVEGHHRLRPLNWI